MKLSRRLRPLLKKHSLRLTFKIAALLTLTAVPSLTQAAPLTFDPGATPTTPSGGTGAWDLTTTDWSNGTTDQAWTDTTGTVDSATFPGAAGTTTTAAVTLGANLGALGITFNNGGYTISGPFTITLGTGGLNTVAPGTNVNLSNTISSNIALTGPQTWTANSTTVSNVVYSNTLNVSGLVSGGNGILDVTKAGGGIVNYTNATALTVASPVTVTSNAGTINISSPITGEGIFNLTKAGAGTTNFVDTSTVTMTANRTLTSNAGTLGFSQVIAGTGFGLTKAGAGAVQLNTSATYTGATNISAGTLRLNGPINLATSGVNIANGAALNVTLDTQTVTYAFPLTLNGGGGQNITTTGFLHGSGNNSTINLTGGVTLANAASQSNFYLFGISNTLNINSVISGVGGLSFNSGGATTSNNTYNLNTAATYTGNTTLFVNPGLVTLNLGVANALPATTVLTIGEQAASYTATLNLNNRAQTLAGLATVAATPGSSLIATGGTAGILTINGTTSNTFAGVISGAGSLVKAGTGTQTLSGLNTYTGGTTVNGGTLALSAATTAANVAAAGTLTLGGGTLSATGTAAVAVTESFNGGTTLTANTASAVTATQGTATNLTINLGAITRNTGSTVNFTLPTTGSITTTTANDAGGILGGYATVGGTDFAKSAGTGTVAGAITAFTGYGTDYTTATATTNFSPTASGVFTNTSINTLRFNAAAAVTTTLNGAFTVTDGGILVTPTVANNASIITGGTSLTSGTSDLSIINNDTSSTLAINTPIVGGIGLTKSGAGTLILGANNTYTGQTVINAGSLNVGNGGTVGSLGTSTANVIDNGTLQVSRSDAYAIANVISGTGSFTKLATGTTTLSGANTYTGGTTINAGTLALSGAGTLGATTNTTTFNGTATLDLGGTTQTQANFAVATGTATDTVTNGNLILNGTSGLTIVPNVTSTAYVLNASGLTSLNIAEPGQAIRVAGFVNSTARSTAEFDLSAGTNTITAASLGIGNTGGSVSEGVIPPTKNNIGTLRLGTTNTINVDALNVGATRGQGILNFQSGLTSPTLTLRNAAGTGRATVLVGTNGSGGATNPVSLVDLSAGSVDALISTLTVSQGSSTAPTTTASPGFGTFIMGTGTLDATNIVLADNISGGGNSNTAIFSQNAGAVTVNSLTLGQRIGTSAAPIISATYNLGTATTAATLRAATIQAGAGAVDATSTRTFNWNQGTVANYNATTDLTINGTDATAANRLGIVLAGTTAHNFAADTGRVITVGANTAISGTGDLSFTGAGRVNLLGATTYSGATNITAGVVNAAATTGQALGGTSSIAISGGGTLLLGLPNQVNTAVGGTANTYAPITMGAVTPTVSAGILSVAAGANQGSAAVVTSGGAPVGATVQGLGALTLNSTSTLAFNGPATTLVFGLFTANGNVLTITGYNNATSAADPTSSGGASDDRLVFSGTPAATNSFDFGSGPGVNVVEIPLDGSFYEVAFAAVPEPSTWVGGLLGLGMIGLTQRRRLGGLLGAARQS